MADEERHFDAFDKQLDNIKRFGPSYLALQSFETAGPSLESRVRGFPDRRSCSAEGPVNPPA